MQKVLSRSACRCQCPTFRPHYKSYTIQPSEVMVKNPHTKDKEKQTVYLQVEESVIEPKLRSSDFDLQVQLDNKVNLTDCGKLFTPSVEQYDLMFKGLARNLSLQQQVVKHDEYVKQQQQQQQLVDSKKQQQ